MIEDFYKLCSAHNDQQLMFVQTNFSKQQYGQPKDQMVKHNSKCSYCIVVSNQDVKNFTNYDNFSQVLAKKYQQLEKIKLLVKVLSSQNEGMVSNKQKKVNVIQKNLVSTIKEKLIDEFEQCQEEFLSINKHQVEYSQRLLQLYKLKAVIEFEEFYFYELSNEAQELLTSFPSMLVYKSSTKPFQISKNNDVKVKKVIFQKNSDFPDQQIKSNLMKFQEKIFIFGDNYGFIYYYNCKTDVQFVKRKHNNQVCVIEKIKEDIFCSGALDQRVILYKINPQDKLIVLDKMRLDQIVFRLKKMDENRIACNQGCSVFILNISNQQIKVEKKLNFPEEQSSDVFGILYMNKQIIALHRDGRLNFWNWKKRQIIRSHMLNSYIQFPLFESIGNNYLQGANENQFQQLDQEYFEQFIQMANNQADLSEQNQNSNTEQNEKVQEDSNMELEQQNEDGEEEEEDDIEDEDWETNSSTSSIVISYSRIRQLSKYHIAAVTHNNIIQIHDFRDFYFKQKYQQIKINFEILCLESIPKTDYILVAGDSLEIYNLKNQKKEIELENTYVEQENEEENKEFLLGSQGLIGGQIFNQSQIASVKLEEIQLIFIQL
ncbi:hypothetical protein TTHERM_00441880 (macronuclear) [Tetrahymena thermophila SB210]|uniref:WD domain, G-beta repeat protein n=1 Tax=Tetrahymena thermophila (strain SB210) TaxID=312017 RepID=I7LTK9_TETTS|nr:hypothetical protein TTHERM_00441880 [Tetrahymena thermophila SB210]EAR85440.2 hypothetical protein TTHERM_00441880 [Tetrahymena thermophila SB210]|eukprot:XP_001033103.2 hypothetical protein TTHERM_00441880 [Tetrahymena thermophila SB210]